VKNVAQGELSFKNLTLKEKQWLFTRCLWRLLEFFYTEHPHWDISIDEAYRPPETAELYEKQGRGIKNSLHCLRLAVDLNLFIDGVYQKSVEPYRFLGEYWKSLHPLCAWGGDFKNRDARHFSIRHGGRE
jgi:hypothetical protein